MSDLILTQKGRAGCITLNRPAALNALTYQMCIDIEAQLRTWRDDPSVELIIIDAAGTRRFAQAGTLQTFMHRPSVRIMPLDKNFGPMNIA